MEADDAALLVLIRAHGGDQTLELLGTFASPSVIARVRHLVAAERAGRLLAQGLPRATIALRLAAAYGISKATAHRAIGVALNFKLSHESRDLETADRQD
jgi:hypothetical protein